MRMMVVALVGLLGTMVLAAGAQALPAPGHDPVAAHNIVSIANGCGPGWHWMPGYRRWDGAWIPGRCVRNY